MKSHKYLYKVGNRYFYSQEEYDAFRNLDSPRNRRQIRPSDERARNLLGTMARNRSKKAVVGSIKTKDSKYGYRTRLKKYAVTRKAKDPFSDKEMLTLSPVTSYTDKKGKTLSYERVRELDARGQNREARQQNREARKELKRAERTSRKRKETEKIKRQTEKIKEKAEKINKTSTKKPSIIDRAIKYFNRSPEERKRSKETRALLKQQRKDADKRKKDIKKKSQELKKNRDVGAAIKKATKSRKNTQRKQKGKGLVDRFLGVFKKR